MPTDKEIFCYTGHMAAKDYKKIEDSIAEQIAEDKAKGILSPYRCSDEAVLRRNPSRDKANLWRPPYVRDCEKILHLPVYNRYADKTQVFSFYKNDDLTRRMLHVQLVSRIARSIGSVLGLNTDLIEAMALGHDIGHTPFGHPGERFLSKLLESEIGLKFNHNVHSVRVLDTIFRRNVSLQTLDGIICHNGEFEQQEYRPRFLLDGTTPEAAFAAFDATVTACDQTGDAAIKQLVPMTLEGCVVRICDMIAYLGKDRQDAVTAKLIPSDEPFTSQEIGTINAKIINNLTVDIINNSYGKDYILLSPEYFQDLKTAKKENYEKIYMTPTLSDTYNNVIQPMFAQLFNKLRDDLVKENTDSPIFSHHLDYMSRFTSWYEDDAANGTKRYDQEDPNRIVTDYIASMTDDYFIDLYENQFPDSELKVAYKSYFE